MKRYRIKYHFNCYICEWTVKAADEAEAVSKFRRIKGREHEIIEIREIPREY